jgi:TonB family protein
MPSIRVCACTFVIVVALVGQLYAAPPQEAAATSPILTPGLIALVANKLDAAGIKVVTAAIVDRDPVVRAVAARIVAVAGYAPLGAAIAQALEREEDRDAATEQARALLYLRGDAAAELIEKRMSSFNSLGPMFAEWTVRAQPQKLADALPRWAAILGDKRSQLNRYVRAALGKAGDSSERLLRVWLELNDAEGWSSFLSDLQLDGSRAQNAVLIDALKATDGDIREATVWMLVTNLANDQHVPDVLLDAATQTIREAAASDGNATWEQFGRELIARRRDGKKTADRSALIAAQAPTHTSDARAMASLDRLLDSERRALRTALGDNYPVRRPSLPKPPEVKGGAEAEMRTFPRVWPGLLKGMLTACKVDNKGQTMAAVLVGYDVGGRVNRISTPPDRLPAGCSDALIALARLTLADAESPTDAGTSEWLIMPLDAEFVECSSQAEPVSEGPPTPVGRKIVPPRKTRDLRPVYPERALSDRIQGSVVLESVISRTGCIHSLRVMRSANPMLNIAALKAVSAWRFTPTLLEGRPVPIIMTVIVNFTLQ